MQLQKAYYACLIHKYNINIIAAFPNNTGKMYLHSDQNTFELDLGIDLYETQVTK